MAFDVLTEDELKAAKADTQQPQSQDQKNVMSYVPAPPAAPTAPTMIPGAMVPDIHQLRPLGQMAKGALEGVSQLPWGITNIAHKFLGTPRSQLLDRFHAWGAPSQDASEAEKIGYFAGQQLPYMFTPVGWATRGLEVANLLGHSAPLMSKFMISGLKALPEAGLGYLGSASASPQSTPMQDLTNAALFGATGHLGRVAETGALRLHQGLKDIAERGAAPFLSESQRAKRAALHPDIGGQIGDERLGGAFQELVETPWTGALQMEREARQNRQIAQQRAIEEANKDTDNLLLALGRGVHPEELTPNVSREIKQAYEAHRGTSRKNYNEAHSALDDIEAPANNFKNTREELEGLIDEGDTGGLPMPRAQKDEALNDFLLRLKQSLNNNQTYNTGNALRLQRRLGEINSDLKGGNNFAQARPYGMLHHAIKSDIQEIAKTKNPAAYKKLVKANEHFQNKVLPFTESNVTNAVINNPFKGVVHAPENLVPSLVKGKAVDQAVINALPQATKNKMAAHLLSTKEVQDNLITPDRALLLSKSMGAKNRQRLKNLIKPEHRAQMDKIRASVEKNKKILTERENRATELGSRHANLYVSPFGHIGTHFKPSTIFRMPMGRFYSDLLTSPEFAQRALSGAQTMGEIPRSPFWAHPALQRYGVRGVGSYAITPSDYSERRR